LTADDEVDELKDTVYRELLAKADRGEYPVRAALSI